jgi:hypothetical protein
MRARHPSRLLRFVASGMGAVLVLAVAGVTAARAEGGLSNDELGQLARGETVVRPQNVETADGRRYVGGVTYTVLEASAVELMALLDDAHAYTEILPKTKFAQRVAARGPDVLIELHQGNALVDAAYTLHIRKEVERNRVRFWLDLSRPHAIDDAWGYFRYEPMAATAHVARTLLVYGALVDLGPGIIRELYEERLRRTMLAVPQLVRRYLERVAPVGRTRGPEGGAWRP